MSQVKPVARFTDEAEALFLRWIRTGEHMQIAYARLVEDDDRVEDDDGGLDE